MKAILIDNQYYKLHTDPTKNRIYFSITGSIKDINVIPYFVEDWKKAISEVSTNFTVLSDVRAMGIQSKTVEKLHESIQSYLMQKGISKVAEVIAINDIADLQATHIVQRSGIHTKKFKNVEQAENYLDKIVLEFAKLEDTKKDDISIIPKEDKTKIR
ncbi:hypothetical protein ACE193_22135 [Bernardetia sp. OM2101]|uniref:hypothetical protein n=1 Tax=Bernardetia sp. OM2101 TaxID=3344876 RepID=UPI0035D117F0